MSAGRSFDEVLEDATARVREAIVEALTADYLTPLANRWGLEDTRSRWSAASTAVISVELDGFKSVNAEYGHEGGDLLIAAVGDRLAGMLAEQPGAIGFHPSGDEFIVLLGDVEWPVAERLAEQIKVRLESPSYLLELPSIPPVAGSTDYLATPRSAGTPVYRLTTTVALAYAAGADANVAELIREADALTEYAKQAWDVADQRRRGVVTRSTVGPEFAALADAPRRRFHCPACGRYGYVTEPSGAAACSECRVPVG